jgi:hypothetical protein
MDDQRSFESGSVQDENRQDLPGGGWTVGGTHRLGTRPLEMPAQPAAEAAASPSLKTRFHTGYTAHLEAQIGPDYPAADGPSLARWAVALRPANPGQDNQAYELDLSGPVVIGRRDAARPVQPDLDLEPRGGIEMGVSRQHAVLIPGPSGLWLIDLDSVNGTWVNGLNLPPGRKCRLQEGDEVMLGLFKLEIAWLSSA